MKGHWIPGWKAGLLALGTTLLSASSARAQLLDVTLSVYGMD